LEEILTGGGTPAPPIALNKLRTGLTTAWQDFGNCRYQALALRLPSLIRAAAASRDQAAGGNRRAFNAALADAYVLAFKTKEDAMAWVAADRAQTAARDSEDPATIAAACRSVAIAMRRIGHYDAATTLLTRTALDLGGGHGNPPTPVLAAYGSLLCTAAYACAQNARHHQALDLIGEAQVAATRMGGATAGCNVVLHDQRRGVPDRYSHLTG
jgi:hypothetical protein